MNIPKSLIRSLYDIQHLRIQTGNRIVAEVKARMGQLPGQKEETIDDAEAKQYLDIAPAEYKRIADAFVLNRAANYFKIKYEQYQIISDPFPRLSRRGPIEALRGFKTGVGKGRISASFTTRPH